MKKYFKYIMIIIASLFVIIGMNVKAESLCSKVKSGIFNTDYKRICSWTYDGNNKIYLEFSTQDGKWKLDFSKTIYSIKTIKEDNLKDIFGYYNNGSYKYDEKNFTCPKGVNNIEYKNKKIGNPTLTSIEFTSSKSSKSKLVDDYPNEINAYVTEIKKEIDNTKCSDKSLRKIKGDVTEQCDFTSNCGYMRQGEYVNDGSCLAARAPLVNLIEKPQKELQTAYENKSKSCNCDEYTSDDKKNCEKNKDELEKKAEKVSENTESVMSATEFAVENYDYKRVVIDEEEATCEGILSKEGTEFLQKVLKFVQYGGVIVALLSSTLDFIKSVSSGSQDDLKKSSTRFLKRMIFAALLFFVVILTNILLGIFNITVPNDCV